MSDQSNSPRQAIFDNVGVGTEKSYIHKEKEEGCIFSDDGVQ